MLKLVLFSCIFCTCEFLYISLWKNQIFQYVYVFFKDCLFVLFLFFFFFVVWMRFMVVIVFGLFRGLRERKKRAEQLIVMASVLKKSIEKTVNRNSYKYFRLDGHQREDLMLCVLQEITMYIPTKRSNMFWIMGNLDILNSILWQTSHWVLSTKKLEQSIWEKFWTLQLDT